MLTFIVNNLMLTMNMILRLLTLPIDQIKNQFLVGNVYFTKSEKDKPEANSQKI